MNGPARAFNSFLAGRQLAAPPCPFEVFIFPFRLALLAILWHCGLGASRKPPFPQTAARRPFAGRTKLLWTDLEAPAGSLAQSAAGNAQIALD